MVAVGVVVLPTAAQVTYVEMRGLGGPGLSGLWLPFTIAGVAGLLAAVLALRLGDGADARGHRGRPGWPWWSACARCGCCCRPPAGSCCGPVRPARGRGRGGAHGRARQAGGGARCSRCRCASPRCSAGFLLGSGMQVADLRGDDAAGAGRQLRGRAAYVGAGRRLPGGGGDRARRGAGPPVFGGRCGDDGRLGYDGAAREGGSSWPEAGPEREWRRRTGTEIGTKTGQRDRDRRRPPRRPWWCQPPAPSPEDDPGNGPVHP